MSTTATSLAPRRGWSSRTKRTAAGLVASAAVLAAIAWLNRGERVADIVADVAALGSAIGLVIALHVAVVVCDGAAWRALLATQPRASVADFLWARWVREAANSLLPVAQLGGEVVGVRVLALRGMNAGLAGASVVLDKIAEALSQIPFTLLGLLLMLAFTGRTPLTTTVALALAVAVGTMAAVLLARQTRRCRGIERHLIERLARAAWPAFQQIQRVVQAIRAIYRTDKFMSAIAWHLLGWIVGAGEVWLALLFMGHPIGVPAAIALESLAQAITSLAFVVPASLGVQEGAYIAVGGALGVPAEVALALSLVKRMRQFALGVPALCSWQALELRQWLAAAVGQSAEAVQAPSSHSNSYVRQWVRALLKPFAATALTPNVLTWLRIVTGLAACVACATATPQWQPSAAMLWLISTLLDRGDGEFARLTGRCTEWGRRLDYWGDVAINALIFFAVGINLRNGAWGDWTILIGATAAVTIAGAAILAEALELRIGQKTVPSRHGFDSDDILFVLVPILWFGQLAPLLAGAFFGGIVAVLYLWRRLSRLAAPQSLESGATP
jgi:putative membrane protein